MPGPFAQFSNSSSRGKQGLRYNRFDEANGEYELFRPHVVYLCIAKESLPEVGRDILEKNKSILPIVTN